MDTSTEDISEKTKTTIFIFNSTCWIPLALLVLAKCVFVEFDGLISKNVIYFSSLFILFLAVRINADLDLIVKEKRNKYWDVVLFLTIILLEVCAYTIYPISFWYCMKGLCLPRTVKGFQIIDYDEPISELIDSSSSDGESINESSGEEYESEYEITTCFEKEILRTKIEEGLLSRLFSKINSSAI